MKSVATFLARLIVVCLIVQTICNPTQIYAEDESISGVAEGINVAYHSEEEIKDFINSKSYDIYKKVKYEEPYRTTQPYNMGRLTYDTLISALDTINIVRFIAGISSDITLNDEYCELSQAASLVNTINNELTHYPEKPKGMSEEMYRLGSLGARNSNIAMGYENINTSIIYGYMNDGDYENIDRVGHRRWILNPNMEATGFGYVDEEYYTAMYASDSNKPSDEYGIAWPAQTMPIEYFGSDYPWSISMGYDLDIEKIDVELERLRDNKIWKFNKNHSDGFFTVDNGYYGMGGCIIFKPKEVEEYQPGDIFRVRIMGTTNPVSYEVKFFDLNPVTSIKISKKNQKEVLTGGILNIYPITTPKNPTSRKLICTISNKGVAKLLENNEYIPSFTLLGKKSGKTKLTITDEYTGVSKSFNLKVVSTCDNIKTLKSDYRGSISITFKEEDFSSYKILISTDKNFKSNVSSYTTWESKTYIRYLKPGVRYYVKACKVDYFEGRFYSSNYGKVKSIVVHR